MTNDLLARLRAGTQVPEFALRQEAADEIERLRAVLREIAERGAGCTNKTARAMARRAREALGEG